MPFFAADGTSPPRLQIEQDDGAAAEHFDLVADIVYVRPNGLGRWTITPTCLGPTNFATIPWYLRWFVLPYGLHTLAAILHDFLVDESGQRRLRGAACAAVVSPPRPECDAIFLEALADRRVPWLKRWLMYAAVTFITRLLKQGWLERVGMIMWLLLATAGTLAVFVFLPCSLIDPAWWRFAIWAAGALAPLAGGFLWWPVWRAGMLFGYGVLFLLPAAAAVQVSMRLYRAFEGFLGRVR